MDSRWELTKALLLARRAADAVWKGLEGRAEQLERVAKGGMLPTDEPAVLQALLAAAAELRFRELKRLKRRED